MRIPLTRQCKKGGPGAIKMDR